MDHDNEADRPVMRRDGKRHKRSNNLGKGFRQIHVYVSAEKFKWLIEMAETQNVCLSRWVSEAIDFSHAVLELEPSNDDFQATNDYITHEKYWRFGTGEIARCKTFAEILGAAGVYPSGGTYTKKCGRLVVGCQIGQRN